MGMQANRFLGLVVAVLPLAFSSGCLSLLLGERQIERDIAKTALDIDRIAQVNLDTQRTVTSALNRIESKSKTDVDMIVSNLAALEQRIDALQESLGIIRSQIEEIRYQTGGEGPERVAIQIGEGDTASTAVVEGRRLLLDGENALTRENYASARASFLEFLKRFPTSARAPDAQMKIADSYYREKKWAEARAAYETVEQRYLTSPRVPEALMKMALCEEQLGRETEAVTILERLIERHAKWEHIQRARDMLHRFIKVEPLVPPIPPS